MRWLALGDSYTIGESVAIEDRWPCQLQQQFQAQLELQLLAQTGWSVEELLTQFHRACRLQEIAAPYDWVSALVGVNNQYRNHPVDQVRPAVAALLGHALQLNGGRVDRLIVVSIPDWGRTPFATGDQRSGAQISQQIDAYNAMIRELTNSLGARFVEITEHSRANATAEFLAADGLHPNRQMYRHWAESVAQALSWK